MLFADRGDWAMQTGPFIMCAGGMLQHDKQATSHCLCAARYSALRIAHSALRIRSQNRPPPRGFTLGANGWSAVDRTIRECGMRSAECGMLFADRGDWAMQTGPFNMCAGGCSNTTSRRLHTRPCAARYSAFRIPHSALRIRSQNRPPPRSCTLGATGWSAVDRTIRECGMRNVVCRLRRLGDVDRTVQYVRGVMLQHDKQTNSHSPWAARYSAFVPRTGLSAGKRRTPENFSRLPSPTAAFCGRDSRGAVRVARQHWSCSPGCARFAFE